MNEMTLEELWQLFPIALSDHRAEWADRFARERRRILSFLPNDCPVSLSHIGSTAIPGIKAKNIVDILAETAPARFEKVRDAIAANGYTAMSESAGRVSSTGDIPSTALRKRSFTFICAMRGITKNCCFGII